MILMLASCMSEPLDVPGGRKGLQVSLEPDTKIQLNENRKPVWTKGDLLSVYDRTDANNQYMFDGNTGDRSGRILSTGFPEYGSPIDECIVVYPYSPDYVLDASGKTITATFPATQHYLKNSYGLGENILVSCGTGDTFTLRNVYGWLEFQFLGTKSIRKIELMDNKPSLLAGPITINYKSLETALVDSSSGDGDDVIATISRNNILTLDCGESGVQLDPLTPVSFFITLLPRTFDSGYSIKISYTDGSTPDVLKSTIKEVVERNTIKQYNPIKLNGVENPIVFADSAVKSICVANWDTNGDGELSYAEAAAVTDLGNVLN